MSIHPSFQSIKLLFEHHSTFEVPKYQRGYAWEDDSIADFVEDISKSLRARLDSKSERSHFFGGIVATEKPVTGSGRHNYEVIDGQQRLASFVMLVAAMVDGMKTIVQDLEAKNPSDGDDKKALDYLRLAMTELKATYLVYRDTIELVHVELPKLKLSEADDAFFRSMLTSGNAKEERASHDRLQEAWKRLRTFVRDDLLKPDTSLGKAKNIEALVNVLAQDCTIIFMKSDTQMEAYRIFQVLNDRGVSLTDGDLLRARTLEALEDKALAPLQSDLAQCWDRILAYPPGSIGSFLQWYYSSYQGQRPRPTELVDEYLATRFSYDGKSPVSKERAKSILDEARQMDSAFDTLQVIGEGQWPYSDSKATKWDRERLRMLVTHLAHTNAMPLLLSLKQLDETSFCSAIGALERFVFRYKTTGNVHIGRMASLYLKHAKEIRINPNYSAKSLRSDLHKLATEAVPDSVFEANLRALQYAPRGSNSNLRYMLITLEDHLKWYANGANGEPKCLDKTRVFDLSGTTLEHVYPRSPSPAEKNADLDAVRDSLGNLTILGPDENDKLANKPFAEKQKLFATSSMTLNKEIADVPSWTKAAVVARTDRLVKMALKVFVP